jgi:Icc-related predicted phosphoesterase
MKILALSDRVVERVYSEHIRHNYGDVDLVVGCGDLPYYYLEYVVSMLDRRTLFVRGNHDADTQYTADGRRLTEPEGAESLEDRLVCLNGLLFMGLGGSMRYKTGAAQQYTEGEMRVRVLRMLPALLFNRLCHGRFVDVVVTHSPPYRIHDRSDRAHTGFKVFRTLMTHFKPRYLLHGHAHIWRANEVRETVFQETTVVNVYPVHVIDIAPPEDRR